MKMQMQKQYENKLMQLPQANRKQNDKTGLKSIPRKRDKMFKIDKDKAETYYKCL